MPNIKTFNTNQDLLDEVLRVKHNQINLNKVKIGIGIQNTIEPNSDLSINDWFIHIKNSLKDLNNKDILLAKMKKI